MASSRAGGCLAVRSPYPSQQPPLSKAQAAARTQLKASRGRGNATRLAASGDAKVAAVAIETQTESDARAESTAWEARKEGADASSGPVVYIGDQVAHSLHERGREVFRVRLPIRLSTSSL